MRVACCSQNVERGETREKKETMQTLNRVGSIECVNASLWKKQLNIPSAHSQQSFDTDGNLAQLLVRMARLIGTDLVASSESPLLSSDESDFSPSVNMGVSMMLFLLLSR